MNRVSEPCRCKEIKEQLIDLYIDVKIRNENVQVTPDGLIEERSKLKYLDSMDLIEYLRSSIEILLSLNFDNGLETTSRHMQGEDETLKKTPSVQCNTSILNRNIPDDEDNQECLSSSGGLSQVEVLTTRRRSLHKPRPSGDSKPLHQR